ncbi:protein tyrosine phosphatase [Naviculisporaceae sp. PSN 640]
MSTKSSSQSGFGLRKAYLVAYNAASAVAWATVLGRVAVVLGMRGAALVPIGVNDFARTTQTFAVMEIFHALTGIVPAPLFTTIMQVFSRLVLVWGISYPFPQLNGSPWYSSMLIAWATTEVIRYTYFVFKQFGDNAVPYFLHWLRYSAFLILYPIGISSEVAMMYKALVGPAQGFASWYPMALISIMLSYIPGSVILYSHMLRQRRKQVGGASLVEKQKKRQ